MTIKAKSFLLGMAAAALVAGAAVWFTQDFWIEQLRPRILSWLEQVSHKYGNNLPEFDRLELSVLGPEGAGPDGFPERVHGVGHPILSQQVLTGEKAADFGAAWRAMTFGLGLGALCHEPAYGLRFYRDTKLIFETTLCWKCSNFSIPTPLGSVFYGFNRATDPAKRLWELIQRHAPLPEETTASPD